MPLITIPDNPADRGYDLSLKGKSNRESLLRNCHYGITLKLLIIPIKTTVGTKDSRSAIEEKIQRLKKKKARSTSTSFHRFRGFKIVCVLLSLARARARYRSELAHRRRVSLSLSLPRVKKFLRHIPRLAMKIAAAATEDNQSF